MNTQDLPFNWNLTRNHVCPAVLTCNFKTSFHVYIILSGKHIIHTSVYLLYPETCAHSDITYLDDSTNLLSLFRVLRNPSISLPFLLHPNSWMTHITCRREVKLITPIHITFINPSCNLHTLKNSDLDLLHLNTLNIYLCVS
jgi:hypothetical protein